MTKMTDMTISEAMSVLREGGRVARPDWSSNGMMLQMFRDVHALPTSPHAQVTQDHPPRLVVADLPADAPVPIVGQRREAGIWVPWIEHQADAMANDWQIV